MHILITGGTGLIGRALCHQWAAQGHQLTVWSRRPEQVPVLCGTAVRGVARLEDIGDDSLDAVVNLAGAPIADRPWSKARKQLLWESRIGLTERLVNWLQGREQKPAVLLSGSAVGWYGDAGEHIVDEQAPSGADFAAQLCIAWEESAQQAEAWASAWYCCAPAWCWPRTAAFSSVWSRRFVSAWAGASAVDASGCRGFTSPIKSP